MSGKFNWLHLSDFHVGMDDYGQRKLFREIVSYVANAVGDGFRYDCVFITGDIANKGLDVEYDVFLEELLVPITEAMGAQWQGSIFSVPGNHDVDRRKASYFSPTEILKSDLQFFDPTALGNGKRAQFFPRFDAYTRGVTSFTQVSANWLESDQATYSSVIATDLGDVVVIGCNTAWLSKDEQDRHRLSPGVNAIADALAKANSAALKIVLGHHPTNWMDDDEALRLQTVLAKHNAIYVCGHLHQADGRYEDGAVGNFLSLRCGAAFQGRNEDQPRWVNGMQTVSVDLAAEELSVSPVHWSSTHGQWKSTTEAFPNEKRRAGTDEWVFRLPKAAGSQVEGGQQDVPSSSPGVSMPIPNGWTLVDERFLEGRRPPDDDANVIQFFDGRPPDWSLAQSKGVPRRQIVADLRGRFAGLQGALSANVTLLLGAGGEGKSTAFMQTIADLVRVDNWVVLFRHGDETRISAQFLEHLSARYEKVLVASDDAHSLTAALVPILERLRNKSRKNVHFLLCARTIDWRAEVKADQKRIVNSSDYHEVVLRGLKPEDASEIVGAWAKFGKAGLNELYGRSQSEGAELLLQAAKDMDSGEREQPDDDGVLLGAMLRMRYGDKLKDKVRSIIYRLKDIPAPGGTVLDVFALIAAMHGEGMRFLSVPVLAEVLRCSISDLKKRALNPLADEAIAAGGGRFVLCRHRNIAKAAIEILRENNLFGDIDQVYPKLSRAAITARTKGEFVPDLASWDYKLPKHFEESGRLLLAVSVSEALLEANPIDIHLRVNLSKIYRKAGAAEKAARLFSSYSGEFSTRAMWTEWSVAAAWDNETSYSSVLLAAAAICDLPRMLPPSVSEGRALTSLSQALRGAYERFGKDSLRLACLAAIEIGETIPSSDTLTESILADTKAEILKHGPELADKRNLVERLADAIRYIRDTGADVSELTDGRVTFEDLVSYRGLAALVQSHSRAVTR